MNDNNLTIEVYSSGTTQVVDIWGDLARAEGLQFNTGYPGGLYLDANFFVPRDITVPWNLRGGQRVVFRNGLVVVYEGYIASFDYIDDGSIQGIRVNCEGAYSRLLMQRRWNKLWSDTRTDEKTWQFDTATSKAEIWESDRNERIIISAKAATFASASTDDAYIVYSAPKSRTIGRMTYDYTFNEYAGRDFKIWLEEYVDPAWAYVAGTEVATTGTGSIDVTMSASVTKLRLCMGSFSAQTVAADERNLGAFTNLCVYSTTATIDLPQVAKDIRAEISEINSTEVYIGSLASARSLCGATDEPASFGHFDFETMADILAKGAAFGDGNNDRYSVGLRRSDLAPSPDGKPVMYLEKYPVLTSWDVSVRLDDFNLTSSVEIKEKYNEIYNYVTVKYSDDNGFTRYLTPGDDANLTDATSTAAYGRREYLLDVGYSSPTQAAKAGYRFLAAYKNPQFELSGPITVMGRIRTLSGEFIPASQVTAGTRLKIENFLHDVTGTGQGVTFLVSSTHYDDASETLTLTAGPPPDLIFPQMVKPVELEPIELWGRPAPTEMGGGSVGDDKSANFLKSGKKKSKAAMEAWEKAYKNQPKGKKG